MLAKQLGFNIVSPKFGLSRAGFFFDKATGAIYKSVDSIKGLNKMVAEEMYALRDNHYDTFTDLLYDLNEKTSLKSNQLDSLIKLDFFSDFGDINKLLYMVTRFNRLTSRKTIKVNELVDFNLEANLLVRYSDKITPTRIEEIDVDRYITANMIDPAQLEKCHKPNGGWSTKKVVKALGLNLESPDMLPYATKIVIGSYSQIRTRDLLVQLEQTSMAPKCPVVTRIQYQMELLGYVEYKNPDIDRRIVFVMNLDTKYSPRFTAYCLKTGEMKDLKVHKKKNRFRPDIVTAFADTPFKEGDILYMKRCKQEPKMKKQDDGWIKDWSQLEWWIKDYRVITDEFRTYPSSQKQERVL